LLPDEAAKRLEQRRPSYWKDEEKELSLLMIAGAWNCLPAIAALLKSNSSSLSQSPVHGMTCLDFLFACGSKKTFNTIFQTVNEAELEMYFNKRHSGEIKSEVNKL